MKAGEQGRVTFRTSREVTVAFSDGSEESCEFRGRLRRRTGGIAVGDRVVVDRNSRVVESVLPRRNWLSRRREVGGGSELIVAANIDQVVAVFSAKRPRLKFGALDRLLAAAERHDVPARIVINKSDLGLEEVEDRLRIYPEIGYPLHFVSVLEKQGLAELEREFRGRVSVVSGPSGVGKSSLLVELLGVEIRVGEVSERNEKGKHTTTAARLYPIPPAADESRGDVGGSTPDTGALVDTPGFRDYGLWGLAPRDVADGFREIAPLRERCRFADCLHRSEPGCAVRQAVEAEHVAPARYESYLHILASVEDQ